MNKLAPANKLTPLHSTAENLVKKLSEDYVYKAFKGILSLF